MRIVSLFKGKWTSFRFSCFYYMSKHMFTVVWDGWPLTHFIKWCYVSTAYNVWLNWSQVLYASVLSCAFWILQKEITVQSSGDIGAFVLFYQGLENQVSISPTKWFFRTKVFCTAFMFLQVEFIIFWQKENSAKAACKMLVKLTTVRLAEKTVQRSCPKVANSKDDNWISQKKADNSERNHWIVNSRTFSIQECLFWIPFKER